MKTVRLIIMDEVMKDEKGNVIAVKEHINEIYREGNEIKSSMREVIKGVGGRIIVDRVLYQSVVEDSDTTMENIYLRRLEG